jgi:hypothetical protein
MHAAIMPLALEMEQRLFAPLSDEEHAAFKEMLGRVRAAAGSIEPADKGDPE